MSKGVKKNYTFIGLENNVPGCESLYTFKFPKNPLFIIGSESTGISKRTLNMCDHIVFIEQEGSCRSLNAAVAGSIIMYEWSRR
jgi:TrmH family RNA methyltransferase